MFHRQLTLQVDACFPSSFFWHNSPPVGQGLVIHQVSRSHITTHHSRQDSSGRGISSSQRPLHDNTQQSQQTDIHAPGGIRTHNLSRRAAADPRLRPRGHWDGQRIGFSKPHNRTYAVENQTAEASLNKVSACTSHRQQTVSGRPNGQCCLGK